jgi:hypothetical protein
MSLVIKTTGFEEYLDANGTARVKALILGEHGVGKTPFAASWPRPIFADCEKGMMSVAKKAVPFASVRGGGDFEAFLQHVKRDNLLPVDKRKYDTVVVDTINSLQRKLITQRLRAEHKDGMAGPDWNWLGTKMGGYLEDLLNLDMNVVVLMHVKDKYDKDDSDEKIIVKDNALKGDLSTSIYRDFDLIGYMESYYKVVDNKRELARHIRWQSDPKIPMVRDRSANLPRFTDVTFAESDYTTIFEAVFGDVDSLPESSQLADLETEQPEGDVAEPEQKGGPVQNPSTPKAPPAKKAAAKKAPAKKAAAKPEPAGETAPEPTPEPDTAVDKNEGGNGEPAAQEAPAETPAADTTTDVPEVKPDPDAEAQALLEKELGAVAEDAPAETTAPPAEEPPVAPQERAADHICGDAKPGLTAKVEGCGTPLTPENSSKLQIARLKYHTDLCESCFQRLKTA